MAKQHLAAVELGVLQYRLDLPERKTKLAPQ